MKRFGLSECQAWLTQTKAEKPGRSPLVSFLEDVFCCGAVDVQCGKGEHCPLRYVAGYISKASDALKFQKGDRSGGSKSEVTHWRTVYRLLCKRAPLEQEMAMHFAGLPMVKGSFTGDRIYAPIPGSAAVNKHRRAYLAYQERLCNPHHEEHGQVWGRAKEGEPATKLNFLQWFRCFQVATLL